MKESLESDQVSGKKEVWPRGVPHIENLPEHSVNSFEIGSLAAPIGRIMKQLRERVDQGAYDVVIGDDASGRIPALIIAEVIGKIYRQKGYATPATRFFAGSGQGWDDLGLQEERDEKLRMVRESLRELYEQLRAGKGIGRTLIVTDTIVTGGSLYPLSAALHVSGVSFDVATIALEIIDDEDKHTLEKRLGTTIYFGQKGGVDIYNRKSLSGVTKDPGDLFAVPRRKHASQDVVTQEDIQEDTRAARNDAHIVAERVFRAYSEADE